MKQYPTIEKKLNFTDTYCWFDKLDGSNIRAEWSKKKGFYKFGSRKVLINEDTVLNKSIELINEKYAEDLSKIAIEQKWQSAVFFFEFFGKKSMFGQHEMDDKHDVILIDCSVYKQGYLDPRDFINIFKNIDIPTVIGQGQISQELVQNIKDGLVEGLTYEGVVFKPIIVGSKFKKRTMIKVKTDKWINDLKAYCKEDEKLFQNLV